MDILRKQFQILSLDGGGIKGLFSAAVLTKLEEALGRTPIINHFDMITGSSTGGIIALALGFGKTPQEIVDLYRNLGSDIFNGGGIRNLLHPFYRKFNNNSLMKHLKETFGNSILGDSQKRLIIPSFNLDDNKIKLYKTPHHKDFEFDWKIPTWQVAMATSAAPSYFPVFKDNDRHRLIDGGIWGNNPTLFGILEAHHYFKVPFENIKVLSIGTSNEVITRSSGLNNGGFLKWAKSAIDISLKSQSLAAIEQSKLLIGNNNFLRIDPIVPKNFLTMDKLENDKLIGFAGTKSRDNIKELRMKFSDHIAEKYTPYYK